MARSFRFYEKKRGNRRTGSRVVGSVGEVVFFAAFLLLGCAWLVSGFLVNVVPEWRIAHEFVEHKCSVLEKKIVETRAPDAATLYRPEVLIEYEISGGVKREWVYGEEVSNRQECAAAIERYVAGGRYPCWYDPAANPRVVVLQRSYNPWKWLVFLVPLSFVAFGSTGLLYTILHWGASAESRAARVQRTQRELPLGNDGSAPQLPGVPDCSDIVSSPGTRLAFRLPASSSPAWTVFGLLAACVLWNGVVFWFVALALHGHLGGRPDWRLTLFILPFAAVGAALAAFFVRQLLVTAGVGPTLVEISDHPLLPGGEYEVFVSQSGRGKLASLNLHLVCEEEAIYRQGTNTRGETREVFRQQVLRCDGSASPETPFAAAAAMRIPAAAMHSLRAAHNAVHWKLVVRGEIGGWPEFRRSFAVVVYPRSPPGRNGG